jgi:DNA-binding transcriptional regulator YdaS (Cro superfamily)
MGIEILSCGMNSSNTNNPEQDALEKAISIIGSGAALAAHLGITKGAVSQWKDAARKIPAEYCPTIERLTEGQVSCEEMRPDVDWAYLRAAAAEIAEPAGDLPYTLPNGGKKRETVGPVQRQDPDPSRELT